MPVAGRLQPHSTITMVVTPGSLDTPTNEKAGLLAADETGLNQVDPINYENPLASDADGCRIQRDFGFSDGFSGTNRDNMNVIGAEPSG
jgi:hypothetical protein